jgi:alkaline phosphatase D
VRHVADANGPVWVHGTLSASPGRRIPPVAGGAFSDGVASGDPGPRTIVLWTRVEDVAHLATVQLEIATDRGFAHVVVREQVATSPQVNGSVKALVGGLRPHEEYFFRFSTSTRDSPVGRFRTAPPPDSREPVRFAYVSCQDYTHGYYNVLEHLAAQDLDFVVFLGDYIYDVVHHSVAGGTGVRDDPVGHALPGTKLHVAMSLEEYRSKYSLYRSDPALRALHANIPMVAVRDDNDVQDGYAGASPTGGLPPERGYSLQRLHDAYRAWWEAMPTFADPIYRRLRFGRSVDLLLLDERRYRAQPPFGNAVIAPGPDWYAPRPLLGAVQMDWLKRALSSSRAAWKVIGNEVMIMPTRLPSGAYAGYDTWQGYPREREELLAHIAGERIDDVVFVTGDIHTFFAGDVRRQMGAGETVAVEFVGASVSSAGVGERGLALGDGRVLEGDDAEPSTPPAIIDDLLAAAPWVAAMELDHHGYGLVRADPDDFDVRFVRLATIKRRSLETLPLDGLHWTLQRGQRSIVEPAALSQIER